MEPGILDTETGNITRIHNGTVRAVAKRSCDVPVCGNGVPEAGEQCDTAGESANCDTDCTAASCGDALVNISGGEQCDDGNVQDGDGCSATCQSEIAVVCGNGVKQGIEECDDGNTINTDDCTNACTNPVCGDSIVWNQGNGQEECDTGGTVTASCDADCTAAICGDGITNTLAGEVCDDANTDETDGCTTTCQYGNPDPSKLTEEEICFYAALGTIPNFLDQLNTAYDGKVVFCHATGPGTFNYLDTDTSACFPHIDHPGDIFPSTICDS